ncbi:hypothetical protein PsorP6_003174 [Peronosclerospora sorghi]|uniref:Uncharacterized protein n=1 Tax=Peronosclerospora sorghi TaxID=230839 RepID=A0ACC0VMT1_9STRA|nr:hypothetical protein PsorP6_003174 [Peronosclerospora sorghi]
MASTTSRANVRSERLVLRSVQATHGAEYFGQEETEGYMNAGDTAVVTDDEIVIDRIMRKKLVNFIANHGKRGKMLQLRSNVVQCIEGIHHVE